MLTTFDIIAHGEGAGGAGGVNFIGTPGGLLCSTYAFMQCGDGNEAAVELDSALKGIATRIIPRNRWQCDALSVYMQAAGLPGNLSAGVYADSLAYEPNGALNSNKEACHEAMTGASAPTPLVASDTNGTTAPYEAWNAFDENDSTSYRGAASDPSVTPQNLAIDLGSGNAAIVNKIGLRTWINGRPVTWTLDGSNLESPGVDSDGDWTTVLVGSEAGNDVSNVTTWFSFMAYTPYRHYRVHVTSTDNSLGIILYRVILVAAQLKPAPGSQLTSFGNIHTGGGAAWTRGTSENAHQFEVGMPVWVRMNGATGVDGDTSIRRTNTAQGSAPPIEMDVSKFTIDGGVTWSECLQDGVRAFWNIVLQSNANHMPVLVYGAAEHDYVSIADAAYTIPDTGIFYDVDANGLDVVDVDEAPYYVYTYASGSSLLLEAEYDVPDSSAGLRFRTGYATHLLVGAVAPRELLTGYNGPIDVPDMALVANEYNERVKCIGKPCPYVSDTDYTVDNTGEWFALPDDGYALAIEVLSLGHAVNVTMRGVTIPLPRSQIEIGLALDVKARTNKSSYTSAYYSDYCVDLASTLSDGVHRIFPIVKSNEGGDYAVQLYEGDPSYAGRVALFGELRKAA